MRGDKWGRWLSQRAAKYQLKCQCKAVCKGIWKGSNKSYLLLFGKVNLVSIHVTLNWASFKYTYKYSFSLHLSHTNTCTVSDHSNWTEGKYIEYPTLGHQF